MVRELQLYHVLDNGHQVTDMALSLQTIRETLGPIQKLEARGLRIVKAGKVNFDISLEQLKELNKIA